MTAAPLALGVLASGRGSNLQAILDEIAAGRLAAAVRVVVSDVADAFALERARLAGVPAVFVDPAAARREGGLRAGGRRRPARARRRAGGARRLHAGLRAGCSSRPSPGASSTSTPRCCRRSRASHVQRQALEHGARFSGCTVHFVDAGVDTGPIVAQAVVPVLDADTEETLAARILRQEHRLYPHAIRLFAEGRLRLEGRRVLVDGPAPGAGDVALVHPPLPS